MSSIRGLVQAEVFSDELEQADELLRNNYKVAAAVITGVVLETTLRELCTRNKIPHAKLDRMNTELHKAGVYNLLQQKQITALAEIRNNAAHGKPEDFTVEDVEKMIGEVQGFAAKHISDFGLTKLP